MKRIDRFFLILAVILTIFLNSHYISGLYYDHDVAYYVNDTLEVLRGKIWYNNYSWGNKPPGINFISLLAFYIFGNSFISIQIFSLIANTLSVIFLYLIAKHILTKEIRFYFLLPLFYGLFSISEAIQGHTSNFETFLSPFEIAGIIFLGLAVKNKKDVFYFLSGFLLGLGFLIKQSALATFIAGLIFIFAIKIVYKEPFRMFLKKDFLFVFAFLIPLLSLLVYFLYLGVWRKFIECVFIRNIRYIKNIATLRNAYMLWTMQQIWKGLKIEIIIFGLLTLIGIFYTLIRYKKPERLLALFWFIIPTFIISRSGFHLRHHFIEILAPLLTLSVMGLSDTYNLAILLFQRKRFFLKIFITIGICILVFPYFHIISPLIKRNKLANSFFLTQRYLNSVNKDKYAQMLVKESYDAARRFFISQYIKEHTTKNDKIFVWDGLASGSIYLWAERDSVADVKSKFPFLPLELASPLGAISLRKGVNYKLAQKLLLQRIANNRIVYIVVVQSVLPMPNAPYSASKMLSLEKNAFKDFFDFLERNYCLEKEIMGCFAYRLISENAK